MPREDFDYTLPISGKVDDYFNNTKNWINYQEAKIIEEKKGEYIKIEYGWAIRTSIHKIDVLFKFNSAEKLLSIKLINSYGSLGDKYLIMWKTIIEDYCKFLDISLNGENLKMLYSLEDINYIIKNLFIDIILSSFLLFGSFIIITLVNKWDIIFIIKVVLFTYWIFLIIIEITFRPLREIVRYKKLRNRLYNK